MYAAKLRLVFQLKKKIEDFEDSHLNIDEVQDAIRETNEELEELDTIEIEKKIAEQEALK